MVRHEKGHERVIFIILRPADRKPSSPGDLLGLPTDGKPITSSNWSSRDQAFLDIVKGIRRAIQGLNVPTEKTHEPTPNRNAGFSEDVRGILRICKHGLPEEVLSAALHRPLPELHGELAEVEGRTLQEKDGIWSLPTHLNIFGAGPAEVLVSRVLVSRVLNELFTFIRNYRNSPHISGQVLNAIELAGIHQFSYPGSAARLLCFVEKILKN